MECKFNDMSHEEDVEVKLDSQVLPKKESFKYLVSVIQDNGKINKDVVLKHDG